MAAERAHWIQVSEKLLTKVRPNQPGKFVELAKGTRKLELTAQEYYDLQVETTRTGCCYLCSSQLPDERLLICPGCLQQIQRIHKEVTR